MCSHSHTHRRTHAHQRKGRPPGGPSGLSKHQHLAPSTSGALMGKLCPIHRCEFVTTGEQSTATQRVPGPPPELLSFVHPGRHLFGFANILIHRNSRREWGWGLARHVGRPSVFIQAFSSPRSGNSILETCSGVLVPYTLYELDTAGNSGRIGQRGVRLLQVWAPSQSRAGWSAHRVRTATG